MELNSKNRFINYVNNVIESKKISHAYLIEVNNYDEDYMYVLNFIKMILCNLKYDDISNSDNPIIKQIDNNDYPDLYVVSSNNSVINKMLITNLQKEFANKSLLDNKKIYIIKEAEKLNASSANTILKFLEEPAEDIIAFLLTDNRYHVIETILSRCQVLSLIDNNDSFNIDNNIIDFIDYLLNPKNYFINNKNFLDQYSKDKTMIINYFNQFKMIVIGYLDKSISNNDINTLFSKYSNDLLINILSIVEIELPKLTYNVNIKIWFDSLFARLIGG